VVDGPRSRSVLARAPRAARAARAALHPGEELALLERQRVELEQAVAGLQRAYGETHALFDVLPEVILIHQKGEVLWANRAAVRTLGYASLDELVGRSLSALLDAASRGVMRERMQRVLEGEPIPELTEARLRTRSGASVLLELFPSQAVSFRGESARLLFGRDITERERLEQKLRAADRMASIGMLAAGVAHEVNNPLGYVLNNVEMAVRELGPLGEGAKRSRAALGVALEGVDRIRVIVRDLLELARVDDRAVGPVDVRRVVESTLALAGQKIAERATLQADYEPVPLARGTASRLGQVVLNLVSNALEAMPAETPAANRLGVSVRRSPDGGALLEVRDSGVGISAENAARVLDPFFTTKEAGSGTGLGLAISQRLVAEMGGTLTFESAPGQGSAFRVTLPPAEAAPLRAVEAPAPGAATPAPS
jgi:PAS domain S-box-containing protein